MAKKYLDGFQCLSEIPSGAVHTYDVGIAVAIAKGDALILTVGYIALATTLATATFTGIAMSANTTAEAVANGTIKVQVIQPLPSLQFRVPIEAADLIAVAQRGLVYNISTEDGLDENTAATAYWGFYVDEVDVSADAILINTYGYAIGHFVSLATT